MVNAGRTHLTSSDSEALTFRRRADLRGYRTFSKVEFTDRGNVVLAAHPAQPLDQANAWRIHRHDDAGMAAGAVRIGVGHAQYDQEAALRMPPRR